MIILGTPHRGTDIARGGFMADAAEAMVPQKRIALFGEPEFRPEWAGH
jgi:hypothetical protein